MALSVMATPISVCKAYSPGHITGFFEPQLAAVNPCDDLQKGSRGAGFCIENGIITTVRIFESPCTSYDIAVSGYASGQNEVSRWILRYYLKLVDRPVHISVTHKTEIPIGFGLGASGAGALSLSYALNEALELDLTKQSAAQIAHKAEIVCKTGLGTVMSEFAGGFDVRTTSGAPGIGSVTKIPVTNYRAVMLCIEPISTKSILSSHDRRQKLSNLGNEVMRNFMSNPTVDNFLDISYKFSNSIQLIDKKCKIAMNTLRLAGFGCGMALFGKTIFTLVPAELARQATQCLESLGGTLIECNINTAGAMTLKN